MEIQSKTAARISVGTLNPLNLPSNQAALFLISTLQRQLKIYLLFQKSNKNGYNNPYCYPYTFDNFPEDLFLLFDRNQYKCQTNYSKLADNLNLSFWPMPDIFGTPYNYTFISAVAGLGGRSVNKGHFTMNVFKVDEIILYDDEKAIKVDDDDLLLNVKFQRGLVAATYKKVEYEQEIDDFVEINLWKISESQRNSVDNIFCQIQDSDLGHARMYSLQSLKQNQWLSSEVMDAIFDYVAATRSDTVSFSHIVMTQESSESLLESQI